MATDSIAQPDRSTFMEESATDVGTLDHLTGLPDEWLILLVLVIAGILTDKEDHGITR